MRLGPWGQFYRPQPTPEEQLERDIVRWLIALAKQQKKKGDTE